MKINTLLANSGNYTRGRTRSIKYLVLHYTANNGDTAKGNCNYFAQPYRNASAHYFVDENDIYQSVADKDTAWAVGATTYAHWDCKNNNSISIEMCSEIQNGIYVITPKTVANTLLLAKYLVDKYDIQEQNVLRHYDVTGKNCPLPWVKDITLWVNFKTSLFKNEEEEEMEKVYNTVAELPQWAKATIQKLLDKKYLSGENGKLGLTETAVRVFVVNDRAGIY